MCVLAGCTQVCSWKGCLALLFSLTNKIENKQEIRDTSVHSVHNMRAHFNIFCCVLWGKIGIFSFLGQQPPTIKITQNVWTLFNPYFQFDYFFPPLSFSAKVWTLLQEVWHCVDPPSKTPENLDLYGNYI